MCSLLHHYCVLCLVICTLWPGVHMLDGHNETTPQYETIGDATDKPGGAAQSTEVKDNVGAGVNESNYFIEQLFTKYGGHDGKMTLESFGALMVNLGLGNLDTSNLTSAAESNLTTTEESSHHSHELNTGDVDSAEPHPAELVAGENKHPHPADDEHIGLPHGDHTADHHVKRRDQTSMIHIHLHSNLEQSEHYKCLTADELLLYHHVANTTVMTEDMFRLICPAIVFQIDSHSCYSRIPQANKPCSHGALSQPDVGHHEHHSDDPQHGGHNPQHGGHGHGNKSVAKDAIALWQHPGRVWGFSIVAVVIISLVGLVAVAIIPIIQKVFYNHMLQFLVALAVGALSGDALLHLLPHAIAGGVSHKDEMSPGVHDDTDSVLKGNAALLSIYFFFIMERILTIITDVKNKRKRKKPHAHSHGSAAMLYKQRDNPTVGAKLSSESCDQEYQVQSCDGMVMVVHPNKALREFADGTHEELLDKCDKAYEEESSLSLTNDHDHGDATKNHGHGHSHVDFEPNSIASVAWMVIMGDGIHNLSDGLAIGAAFANSITGGVSTSIAVFCHELPHEIGDFAVLIRAGMSVKQALIYNCVSSVLSLVGMVIGILLGNLDNASLWIFAVVGGMFLYIALVDMLPEMTSVDTKQGEHPFLHLLLQCTGMILGAGIMFLIAIYEEDIKTSLDP